MKTLTAVKKLEKSGFSVITNGTYYSAKKDDVLVEFTSTNGNTKSRGFSWSSSSSCTTTNGLSLSQVA